MCNITFGLSNKQVQKRDRKNLLVLKQDFQTRIFKLSLSTVIEAFNA